MFNPLLAVGVIVFCVGAALLLVHQNRRDFEATWRKQYLDLCTIIGGAALQVIGAVLSQR